MCKLGVNIETFRYFYVVKPTLASSHPRVDRDFIWSDLDEGDGRNGKLRPHSATTSTTSHDMLEGIQL